MVKDENGGEKQSVYFDEIYKEKNARCWRDCAGLRDTVVKGPETRMSPAGDGLLAVDGSRLVGDWVNPVGITV